MRAQREDGVPTHSFEGASGFARFNRDGLFAVPDADAFRSTWREVRFDGIQLDEWSTSPITGSRLQARDAASVTILFVLQGSLRYAVPGDPLLEAGSGSVHFSNASRRGRFSIPEPSRFVRVTMPLAFLGSDVRARLAGSMGSVPVTRVTTGLTFLAAQVLDPSVGGADCAAARAVRSLAVAVIEDSVGDAEPTDLRSQIVEYIDRHITDSELGPPAIADAFGVSVRWVHHVFNAQGDSVARHIRERRLELVAAQLHHDRRFPRIATIAERTGFTRRDQLTRSFKARYGVTIADYALLVAEGRAPAPESRAG